MIPVPLIGTAISTVAGLFQGRQQRKMAALEIEGEVAKSRQRGEEYTLVANANLDLAKVKAAEHSWRDEYLLILFSTPIIVQLLGSAAGIMDPALGDQLMDAGDRMIASINSIGGPESDFYAWAFGGVVSLSVGRRAFR